MRVKMNDFSDVIRTAIKMEQAGINFYHEAAQKVYHPFGKKMLLSFVEDEEKHIIALKNILTELKIFDFDRFLKEKTPKEKIKTIFEEVKSGTKRKILAHSNELKVLKVGMEIELKSIEFYQSGLEKTQESHLKDFFKRLVEEEKEHYQMLENTYSYLKDSRDWYLWEEKAILDG